MIKIVHELRLAKGSNKKKEILSKHTDNELWKQILVAMYDSSINYYTGVPNDFTFVDDAVYDTLLDDLDTLTRRELTGNAARDYAVNLSQKYGEIVRLILGGSLRCGVAIGLINTIYPGLIPTFPLMKGDDYPILKFPIWSSTKYDGIRLVVTVAQGEVYAQTSSGKYIFISSLVTAMSGQQDGVYDGELVAGDGKQIGRTKITGQVNKCLFGTATDIDGYTYCIFDCVSLEEWDSKVCENAYRNRLAYMFNSFVPRKGVLLVEHKVLNSNEEVAEEFDNKIELGYEGIMGRYPEDPYVWDRTPAIIKRKAKIECVLTCVGTTDGEGKYEGMIGALILEGEVNGKEVKVKSGSGLSDYDRELLPEEFIGSRIEAQCNDVILNKAGDGYTLFLCVFKRIAGRIDT